VKWSATAPAGGVRAGSEFVVSLTAKVEPGWKLYALTQPEGGPQKLTIGLAGGAPFTIANKRITGPRAKTLEDETFKMSTHYYESTASFAVPLTVAKTAAPGQTQIPLEVTFQACGDTLCLRPFTQKLGVEILVQR
jgi:DsbC/DsbD-like thiol-disulfide interchange protein